MIIQYKTIKFEICVKKKQKKKLDEKKWVETPGTLLKLQPAEYLINFLKMSSINFKILEKLNLNVVFRTCYKRQGLVSCHSILLYFCGRFLDFIKNIKLWSMKFLYAIRVWFIFINLFDCDMRLKALTIEALITVIHENWGKIIEIND